MKTIIRKAIIRLDVPEWQIGQEASIYFPDSMHKFALCEADNEKVVPIQDSEYIWICGNCGEELYNDGEDLRDYYCSNCGKAIDWDNSTEIPEDKNV